MSGAGTAPAMMADHPARAQEGRIAEPDAVVVFTGVTDLPWLRLLRPGYRHCFVVLRRGGAWLVVDPLAHYTRVDLLPRSLARDAGAVAASFRALGCDAVITSVATPGARLAPVRPFTCVEAVKRVLGLRAPWVVTPWHLKRHIEREKSYITENNLDLRPSAL